MESKIKTLEEISTITSKLQNKRIGYIQGCFDILHIGHIELFKTASSYVDLLIVGVEPAEYITKYKGVGRPLFKLQDRLEVLSHLSVIRYLFVFDNHGLEGIEMNSYYRKIPILINATHLFTNSVIDQYFELRKDDAAINKLNLIDLAPLSKRTSSTAIYKKFLEWCG